MLVSGAWADDISGSDFSVCVERGSASGTPPRRSRRRSDARRSARAFLERLGRALRDAHGVRARLRSCATDANAEHDDGCDAREHRRQLPSTRRWCGRRRLERPRHGRRRRKYGPRVQPLELAHIRRRKLEHELGRPRRVVLLLLECESRKRHASGVACKRSARSQRTKLLIFLVANRAAGSRENRPRRSTLAPPIPPPWTSRRSRSRGAARPPCASTSWWA